jgi:hypothetical protein
MGIVVSLTAVFCFVSLIIITAKSFIKRKVSKCIDIKQEKINSLAEDISEMKKEKEILDKFFVDIGDKNDKPKPTDTEPK